MENGHDFKTNIHSNCTKDVFNCITSSDIQILRDHGTFYSGTTGHIVLPHAPMIHKQPTNTHNCNYSHLPTKHTPAHAENSD